MSYAFDSAGFGELGADAERLAAQTAEHERRLASLVDSVENDCAENLLATLRELCVDARQQRQIANTIRARLLGDTTAPAGPDTEKRPLVLIVDDSPDNRDMAAMLLETSGFDAITAGNGLEGVIVAHYTRPAVVIMDVAMPVLDGVQATKLLKASAVTQDINVIAYTAKMNLDEAPMARLFAGVLLKPASPETIVGLVQRLALPGEPEAA
jgi:two-component system cell cycle response regulator DivK